MNARQGENEMLGSFVGLTAVIDIRNIIKTG